MNVVVKVEFFGKVYHRKTSFDSSDIKREIPKLACDIKIRLMHQDNTGQSENFY